MTNSTRTTQTIADELLNLNVGQVCFDEPLKHHNTWRIGGMAAVMVYPGTIEQLSNVFNYIHRSGANYVVIGDGSNLLFTDAGVNAIVIKIGRSMSRICLDGDVIVAGAGVSIPRLARRTALAGLCGLEHTVGIPGTLGGLVAMNGGSLGNSISDIIQSIRCVDNSGDIIDLDNNSCEFSYRHSIFLKNELTVAEVTLRLDPKSPEAIVTEMLRILRQRRQKFPRHLPNCGSVFKRNNKLFEKFGPPGKVIEDLRLKGFSIGDAQVSDLHANFIINKGNARACDVLALIRLIRERVYDATNIWLDCEARYIDSCGVVRPAHLQPAESLNLYPIIKY